VLLASQFVFESTDRLDFRLGRYLTQEGVEVVMLAPSSVTNSEIVDGIKVYLFKTTPILRNLSKTVFRARYILDMFIQSLAVVKKERIDLLNAFFAIPPGLAMALCKAVTGRPLILSASGADIGVVKEIEYGFRLDPIANKWINFVLKKSDQIIVPSYRFQELAKHAGANTTRTSVIPWGVNLHRFHFMEKKDRYSTIRAKFNIQLKEKIILSLCRHAPVKGLDVLLYAMPIILQKYPNVKLVLAGSGKETAKLQVITKILQINHKVVFAGYVQGEEKLQLLATTDLFVQPSLSDGFAISVLEAMASGIPVVITDKVGLADYIKNGSCGLIVKSGNPEMLANAIIKLLLDDHLRLKLGERAKVKAEEFKWDTIIKRIICVYDNVLELSSQR
jgi:glycosyltransferase involved in cell wall biosynthesis